MTDPHASTQHAATVSSAFTDDHVCLDDLFALFAAHNLKGESVLYPRADAVLSTGERAQLGAVLCAT